jgi:flagellin-like hook-associated protein FlgL
MLSGLQADSERFLADLARIQDRRAVTQNRISSGYRVTRASDDPQEAGNLLQYTAALAHNQQVLRNLDLGRVEADMSQQAVASAE